MLSILLRALPVALQLIPVVEKLFKDKPKSGAEKRAAVLGAVKAVVMGAEAITAKDLVDEEKLDSGLGQIVDGAVDVLKAVGKLSA